MHNDYLKRFNTSKKVIISALIGEDSLFDELNRFEREKRAYYEKIKYCRTYDTFSDDRQLINKKYLNELMRKNKKY